MTRDDLLQLLRRKGAPRPEQVAALALPCLEMQTHPWNGSAPTHLGGLPDLAPGQLWPRNARGESMTFIGQVALAELASTVVAGELPPAGLLGWFFDTTGQGPPEYAMTFTRGEVARVKAPNDVGVLDPRGLVFRPRWSLPSSQVPCPFTHEFDAGDSEAYRDFRGAWELDEVGGHQLLGYADGLDDPYLGTALDRDSALRERWFAEPREEMSAEFSQAARAFRLCAQFWEADMDWGDGAPLSFLLHQDAWAAGRFNQQAPSREAGIWWQRT